MLELTGIAPVLRALGILYWALAAAAIAAALWLPKKSLHKAGAVLLVVGAFSYLPAKRWIEHQEREAYAKAAWAHFHKLCKEKSGEKIYKTFTGVKSVLVVKPLPPATEKDLFDQYWMGDPYSAPAHSRRGETEAALLTGFVAFSGKHTDKQNGFAFVEIAPTSKKTELPVTRLTPTSSPPFWTLEPVPTPASRFAISWEDISTAEDRRFWVVGSRLQVLDTLEKTVVAERVGFAIEPGFGSRAGTRRPWLAARKQGTSCPPIVNGGFDDRWFILSVLRPTGTN